MTIALLLRHSENGTDQGIDGSLGVNAHTVAAPLP